MGESKQESADRCTSDFEAMSKFWQAAPDRFAAYLKAAKDSDKRGARN